MARIALAVLLVVLLLGGLYRVYGPPSAPPIVATPAPAPNKRVVADAGCAHPDTVAFELSTAAVGVPVEGKIGRYEACEGNDVEHISGEIDWGDGTSSPMVPGDYLGKDKGVLIASRHTYARSATYALFARLRAQCADGHGQSTRVISCGSGVVGVK